MSLRHREVLGLVVIITGVILIPVAWAFSRVLWLVAFCLFMGGAWLFYTERNIRKDEELAKLSGPGSCQGSGRPNDIHDYTGWSRAGRSETMDTGGDLGGGDGD